MSLWVLNTCGFVVDYSSIRASPDRFRSKKNNFWIFMLVKRRTPHYSFVGVVRQNCLSSLCSDYRTNHLIDAIKSRYTNRSAMYTVTILAFRLNYNRVSTVSYFLQWLKTAWSMLWWFRYKLFRSIWPQTLLLLKDSYEIWPTFGQSLFLSTRPQFRYVNDYLHGSIHRFFGCFHPFFTWRIFHSIERLQSFHAPLHTT